MGIPEFHVYDSNEVSINVLGVLVQSGFAEGELVRVVMTNDRYKAYEGADGGVSRADTHSKMATVELRLAQTSPTNAALAAAFEVGLVGPIEIADLQGASLHTASKAWITKQPDAAYDRDVKERVWHFTVADMNSFSGGQVV
jgi:hypothetical protein